MYAQKSNWGNSLACSSQRTLCIKIVEGGYLYSMNIFFTGEWKKMRSYEGYFNYQEESPPAWTQEAYRPPRSHSNFLLLPGRGGGSLHKNFFPQSEHVSSQIWCQKFFPLLGGGVPLQKFFSGLNMYQAKSGVKIVSLYWGGGPSTKKFFPQSEHVSSQIWCQKFFPLLGGGGGPSTKIFFPSLNMYQAKSGVKNFSLYWGRRSLDKIFFSQSEHVSSQIWGQKFFPLLVGGGGVPRQKFFSGLNMYRAKSGVKIFSLYWDRVPPPPHESVDIHTDWCQNITFPRTTYAGGKNWRNESVARLAWKPRWIIPSLK